MRDQPDLRAISDDELLRRLSEILKTSRRVEADLVAHIGEVDARRLYRREAAPSMFVYCTERLHLSEQEAYLRIAVARASRQHPMLLTMLRDGRLHLSGIGKLAPHLTRENRDKLLEKATHQSKRRIEELVAALAPRPEAPAVIRRVPERGAEGGVVGACRADQGEESVSVLRVDSEVEVHGRGSAPGAAVGDLVSLDGTKTQLGPDRVPPASRVRPAVVEPRATDRYRLHLDASARLCEKLERLQALVRCSRPDADLAAIIEDAVTEKLERLEAKRFGKTRKPRKTLEKTDTSPRSRLIPAPVRRAVHERDEDRCTYRDRHGRRCPQRHDLEFHHEVTPFGKQGDHAPGNVRLMCRVHNLLRAEEEYGEEVMARFLRSSSRVSESVAVYGVRRTDLRPRFAGAQTRCPKELSHGRLCTPAQRVVYGSASAAERSAVVPDRPGAVGVPVIL